MGAVLNRMPLVVAGAGPSDLCNCSFDGGHLDCERQGTTAVSANAAAVIVHFSRRPADTSI